MTRTVVYSPPAQQQLSDLYVWIATESGFPSRAEEYVTAIISFCDGLTVFPFMGISRDDLRPGLRVFTYRRRITIAFAVSEDSIEIIGVYYAGRDFESLLSADLD